MNGVVINVVAVLCVASLLNTRRTPIIWSPFRGVFSVVDMAFEVRRRHIIWSGVSDVIRACSLVAAAFGSMFDEGTLCDDMSMLQRASQVRQAVSPKTPDNADYGLAE